jgi:PhzF family phenazine biosynthesis protein
MPHPHPFQQVDVFTTEPLLGNPVAVVLGADDLSSEQMQRFARWTNLSETTFVLPPTQDGADYRVRIFTPAAELPFAGHPTLGTCHAWLSTAAGARAGERVVQECGVGLVTIRRDASDPPRLAFAAPPRIRSGPVDGALVHRLAAMLGLRRDDVVDAAWVDNGPGWVAVLLRDAEAVLAVRPGGVDRAVGVVGPYPPGSPWAFEVRAFYAEGDTTFEDPATGSLNASLAQWLLETGRATAPYVASQGSAVGRAAQVEVTQDADGTIWVGGGTVTCVEGVVRL